jgi:DUF4097 and DUF4098 domain-containing protein YvlB
MSGFLETKRRLINMRAMTNNVIPAILIGLLFALPGTAFGFDKTHDAKALKDVSIRTLSGSVAVQAWDKPQVKVEWSGDGPDEKPHFVLDGDNLRIGGQPESDRGLTGDLTVRLPARLRLSIKSISGDLRVQGVAQGVELESISGDVNLQTSHGGVWIKTVSGDVTARDLKGDLEVKSVSGEVTVRDLVAGLVEIKTVSGDIDLLGQLGQVRAKSHSGEIDLRGSLRADGGLQAKSFSGDVDVFLPADAGFDLEASTRSGSVRVEHPLTGSEKSDKRASGRAGQGGPKLRLGSFSGDLSVRIAR